MSERDRSGKRSTAGRKLNERSGERLSGCEKTVWSRSGWFIEREWSGEQSKVAAQISLSVDATQLCNAVQSAKCQSLFYPMSKINSVGIRKSNYKFTDYILKSTSFFVTFRPTLL